MKMSEAFPSKWLAAADLNGKQILAVIAGAEYAVVGNERKVIVSFQGGKTPEGKSVMLKPMVCNKTNFRTIAGILGAESDDWTGGEIVLTSAMVEFGGDIVPGLRVRAPKERIQGNGSTHMSAKPPVSNDHPAVHIPQPPPDNYDPADDEIPF